MPSLIRYGSYPIITGSAIVMLVFMATAGVSYWPLFPAVVLVAYALIAGLERLLPYQRG